LLPLSDALVGIEFDEQARSIGDSMRASPTLPRRHRAARRENRIDPKAANLLGEPKKSAPAQLDEPPSAALSIYTRRRGSRCTVPHTCRLQHWSNEQDAAVRRANLAFQLLSR